jgi:hypothetical protein
MNPKWFRTWETIAPAKMKKMSHTEKKNIVMNPWTQNTSQFQLSLAQENGHACPSL